MDRAEDDRNCLEFHANAQTYFYRLPDGSQARSRLDRWYISAQRESWIRDIEKSVPGPAADPNRVSNRIGAPLRTVEEHTPRYPAAGCEVQASVAACETGKPSKPPYLLPWTIDATFSARVSTKFQANTIVSLGGVASHGKYRSHELAEEMADGWGGQYATLL
uniref:Uncharacterized protein n=1 Tax=Hyaloperonospora arabidopsidis (strain Emoy2) TaxID=559515 RepID=M4C608_HYAAE